MPARYCLTRGGKFWKYDRYERDLILYLVSVSDKVDNFLECEDEMEASMLLEATSELASLMSSAPSMSLSDGPMHEPQPAGPAPRKDPKRKRADVDKTKKALGFKFLIANHTLSMFAFTFKFTSNLSRLKCTFSLKCELKC